MPDQAPARGTERAANREFLGAQRRPSELHVHHVHAGDEQHHDDSTEHGEHRLPQLRPGERVDQRLHRGRNQLPVRLRVVVRQTFGQPNEFRVRLIERHARFQPPENLRSRGGEIATWLWRKFIVERHPQLFVVRERESLRHDADDGRAPPIDADSLSHDGRIAAEVALPDLMSQHSDLFGAWLVIFRAEITAHGR